MGCSASVYDNDGYSAMTHMVEKMPNIALEALSQFLAVDSLGKRKSYYLAPLEGDPKNPTDQKTVLQVNDNCLLNAWVSVNRLKNRNGSV